MWALQLLSIPLVKYFLVAMLAVGVGYYYGYRQTNRNWEIKLQEIENKHLISIRKIETENLKKVAEVSSSYEIKNANLAKKLAIAHRDYGRLRVPARTAAMSDNSRPARPTNERSTDREQRAEQGTINLDGVAKQIIELGKEVDQCYIKLSELQNYVKIVKEVNK